MSKYIFKLLHGTHTENGKRYIAGTNDNIVESEMNLALRFKNKFVTYVPREKSSEDPAIEFLEPVDKGRGMYDVIDTRTNGKINNGYLTQEQAFEWCGLELKKEPRKPKKKTKAQEAEADAKAKAKEEAEKKIPEDEPEKQNESGSKDPLIG